MRREAVAVTMTWKEAKMHIFMLTLTIAFVVCIVLLAVFGLFTTSRVADRIDQLHQPGPR